MLLQFNFKNYKSFRDDTTLDLTATKISEYNHHVVAIGNEKVLPVSAIFGANASGKSNVLEAFRYMTTYVLHSLSYGGDQSKRRSKSAFLKPTPFLLDAHSPNEVSSFEVYFIVSENNRVKTYNYGFTIGSDGVHEEWLNYQTKSSRGDYKRVFYREGETLDLSGIAGKSQENVRIALEKETLVVSLGAKLKIASLKCVQDWFLNNELVDFGHPVVNLFLSKQLPEGFVESKDVQDRVVRYLSAFDTSIIGFDVGVVEEGDSEKPKKVRIDAIHKMMDSEETVTIPLKKESAGTLKMFALYPLLQEVLDTGGVLFIDELSARLHPLLVRSFVMLFTDPDENPHHAQLIFTSHDPWLLDAYILRRDEVWFCEKDARGISSLYSLADFVNENGAKIRKDENYEKNYLLGKYGAIPTMAHFGMLKEE